MIERGKTENYRIEICPKNKRDEQILITFIKKHVAPGSEIHTDIWKGYCNLKNYGYIHKTVNHSENFVDPKFVAYILKTSSHPGDIYVQKLLPINS